MIKEAIDRILGLAPPNIHAAGDIEYSDKSLHILTPPAPNPIECTTLRSLADLVGAKIDNLKDLDNVLAHITSPTEVSIISAVADDYGRRRSWANAAHAQIGGFTFGKWYAPEDFAIAAQIGFQRVKIQQTDGKFCPDLDYVIEIASKVTAERAVENTDDGIAQRVALRQGVSLKGEAALLGRVTLAPWRTFTEVDQPLSEFLFRAKYTDNGVLLALFEADGGRWKLDAIATIKAWLATNVTGVTVIS